MLENVPFTAAMAPLTAARTAQRAIFTADNLKT
jgi:hypothetical protein